MSVLEGETLAERLRARSQWAVLGLLFGLKWRLMTRGYKRDATALIGVLVTVLVMLPISVGLGIGSFAAFRYAPPEYTGHVLRGVLLFIYAVWLLTPLLGYSLNESYDVKRLFLYPLSMRQIFVGVIVGSVMDFTVLLLLPVLAAVVIGFTYGPISFLFAGAVTLLFLFHTLALGQALLLLSQSILSARRTRDLMLVIGPLLGLSFYFAFRYLGEMADRIDWSAFLTSRTWEALSWLPPGMAARSVVAAARGEALIAIACFILLATATAATVYLAGSLLQAAYSGEGSGGAVKPARRRASEAKAHVWAPFGRFWPPVISAMFDKEMKYIVREPYFKVMLMSVVYLAVFFGFFLFGRPGQVFMQATPFMLWGASAYLLMIEMGVVYNAFGTEGPASAMLFTFPASRRQMLIGKNLALFVFLATVNALFMLLAVAVFQQWWMYGPLVIWMLLAVILLESVGNPVSVKVPVRVTTKSGRVRARSAGQGCGTGLLYAAANMVTGLLMLPVLAALLTPCFWVRPLFFVFTIPFSVAYTAGLYLLSLRLTEPMLLSNDVEMIQKLSQEDS